MMDFIDNIKNFVLKHKLVWLLILIAYLIGLFITELFILAIFYFGGKVGV